MFEQLDVRTRLRNVEKACANAFGEFASHSPQKDPVACRESVKRIRRRSLAGASDQPYRIPCALLRHWRAHVSTWRPLVPLAPRPDPRSHASTTVRQPKTRDSAPSARHSSPTRHRLSISGTPRQLVRRGSRNSKVSCRRRRWGIVGRTLPPDASHPSKPLPWRLERSLGQRRTSQLGSRRARASTHSAHTSAASIGPSVLAASLPHDAAAVPGVPTSCIRLNQLRLTGNPSPSGALGQAEPLDVTLGDTPLAPTAAHSPAGT